MSTNPPGNAHFPLKGSLSRWIRRREAGDGRSGNRIPFPCNYDGINGKRWPWVFIAVFHIFLDFRL